MPADSHVIFTKIGSNAGPYEYTDATLATSHTMAFTGLNGVEYTYYVSSTDGCGNTAYTAYSPITFTNN